MSDEDILRQLLSSGTTAAWEMFLRRFSNLILKIVWQFEKDYDEAMEKYLFVCRKLAVKDFAVLRKYEHRSDKAAPRFTTWLAAVTQNFCIDAHRATHGRRQLPRAILRLNEFDREVFRLYYWKGYSLEELEQQLSGRANHNAVADSLERIQSAGVWMTQAIRPTFVPLDEEDARFGSNEVEHDAREMLSWLERWLDDLDDRARMVVRLWFWENMTGREIAEAMRIAPEQRVYTLLRTTLARLREHAEHTYGGQRSRHASVYHQRKET